MSTKIAVIGCGWLGLPLAEKLIKNGYLVHGSTTTKEKLEVLKVAGINAFLISLTEEKLEGNCTNFLKDISIAIINIPPKLRGKYKESYVKKMQLLHNALAESTIQKVIFVSSTAVYGAIEGEVTEKTTPLPVTESGKQLLIAENIFTNNNRFQTTILRLGGLIGGDRHPVTILSGRTKLSNGSHSINLIHRNDCIQIIEAILQNNWWNELFNAVFPYHPKKRDYYFSEAKKKNIPPPDYKEEDGENGKIVKSNRLILVKKYIFTTPITTS